jgi:heparosan-N-sulfate-glucuronate 5-epimerase
MIKVVFIFSITFLIIVVLYSNNYNVIGITITYDKNNLPIVDYGTLDGEYIGKHYNPITITQHSDKYYEKYIRDGDPQSKIMYLRHMDWLVNNAITIGNYSFFEYPFPFPYSSDYQLSSPWYSAMAQGEVVPRLIKAYQITDNKTYLETARKSLNVLFIDIENPCNCGVTIKSLKDGWWYEEYANSTELGPRVLNGMMFTLLGIHDYYKLTGDPRSLYLFNQGILSLKNNLHIYDKNGTHSYYDNQGFESMTYHDIHVDLLGKLYDITRDDLFKKYYENWKRGSEEI